MPVPLLPLRPPCLAAACLAAAAWMPMAQAQNGRGLKVPDQVGWTAPAAPAQKSGSAWKGRIGLGFSGNPALGLSSSGPDAARPDLSRLESVQLLGDYYFSRSGGFRATGGLLRGSIGSPWMLTGTGAVGMGLSRQAGYAPGSGMGLRAAAFDTAAVVSTVPYLGAGYSFDLPQTWGGDWSFSADVGMVALAPGVKLGRGYGASLDDAGRDMRLRPVLQLGVSYSF